MPGRRTDGAHRSHGLDKAVAPHHKGLQGHRAGKSYAVMAQQGYLHQLDPHSHLNSPRGVTQLMQEEKKN